jgi:GT2 family glycosyltransferase
MDTAQTRAEWLSWDGRWLRWRLNADLAGMPATQLNLDGVVFQRFPAIDAGEHNFSCEFPFSPSGWSEMAFSLGLAGQSAPSLLPDWQVRSGEVATPGALPTTKPQRGLTSLIGTPRLPAVGLPDLPAVAVVVPIYNSPHCVKRCIDAVMRWSPAAHLILIDDASTDPRIDAILTAAAAQPNVSVHRNERNRGYTHSVNVGMRIAGGADVVLLNSDTEVGPRWLAALKLAAYAYDDVGTVTAVSDNAGAFSVPELEQHCPIPSRWSLIQAQRAVLQRAGLVYPQLPTGNGFCLFVKRVVIARIGPMDETAFPQGYGEENDFCQRAERAGYRNIIAGNVLVHHERSASFGDARRLALGAQGMAVLRERYPNYERDVGATLFGFARRVVDYRVRRTYADADNTYAAHPPRPRILVAADTADDSAERLLAALESRQEAFLLRRQGDWVNFYRHTAAGPIFERGVVLGDGIDALHLVETRLREWLFEYAIESVHARGSAASDGWLAGLAESLDIPTA